jgi:predicted unusual protein kinase regulating ubiquinone biosynthesis (AarF/ABC1/UbiB family)
MFKSILRFSYISIIILNEIITYKINSFINYYKNIDNYSNRLNCIKNITRKIERINIVYLKFLQSICLDNNLLNNDEIDYLMKYLDNVPYNNNDIDLYTLDRVQNEYDISIDTTKVVNSGMIGIVFNGIDKKNNNKLIIKMLKKDIHSLLIKSFEDLELLLYIISYIPYLNSINFDEILIDNKDTILSQLDFVNETYNILKFRELHKNRPEYVIPFVYNNITNVYNNVIVMENIKGYKYSDIKNNENFTIEDKDKFSKLYQKFGYISLFYTSALHNDLHAGNIFFYKNDITETDIPQYQIGIIDFGICVYLSRENQNIYYNFFKQLYIDNEFTDNNVLLEFIRIGCSYNNINSFDNIINNKEIENNLINEVKDLFLQYTHKNLDDNLVKKLNKILKKYDLKTSKDINKFLVGLKITESLCNELSSDVNKIRIDCYKELANLNSLIYIE